MKTFPIFPGTASEVLIFKEYSSDAKKAAREVPGG